MARRRIKKKLTKFSKIMIIVLICFIGFFCYKNYKSYIVAQEKLEKERLAKLEKEKTVKYNNCLTKNYLENEQTDEIKSLCDELNDLLKKCLSTISIGL